MLLTVTAAAALWLGYEVATRLFRDRASNLEAWAAAFCIGSSLWIASVWAAALAQQLRYPVLLVRTALFAVLAVLLFLRRSRERFALGAGTLLTASPLVAWVAFLLWRTAITPPLTHDALAYHLPRAVLWLRGGGFAPIDLPVDPRMRLLPANYEMLLADAMLLGHGDALTEWIAVFFFVAFVVACGALVRRWWSDGPAAVAAMLLSASVPVLLLHAGADKNDVMTGFFMVSALLWGGRWVGEADRASLLLCLTALAAAIGTKPQGVFLAAAMVPFLAWRLRGAFDRRLAASIAALFVAATLLLGGAFYGSRFVGGTAGGEQRQFVAYDDVENLWQAPWVLLAAPFSPSSEELWVPWSDKPWFWKRDELFFSSLGAPFAACVILIPVAWLLFRRELPERALERRCMALAALAVLLLMLPVRDVPMPHGVYVVALPRYVLFLVPVVFGLTLAPAMRRIAGRSPQAGPAITAVLALWFTYSALNAVLHDRFIPLRYLSWAISHPGTRLVAFDVRRAAGVVDTIAGPQDVIAFDAGYGAWIHPAFGRKLTRPVMFIEPGEGPPVIPEKARWVVSDRSWHLVWQHPGFRDLSQWRTHLGFGRPEAEDLRVVEALRRDPRFELVFYNKRMNQAVFRRR